MDPKDRPEREEVLRRAVLAGDQWAWQAWYQETFPGLYRYVLWRCGGRRDRADEVIQETWLTAVRGIRRFDPRRGSFAAWLQGLAANVLRNRLRGRRRFWAWLARRGPSLNGATGESNSAAPDADQRERQERIAAALDALPERQEAVLRAKYLEGMSVVEIAAAWEATPKTIESLLSRAREAFRGRYERQKNSEE